MSCNAKLLETSNRISGMTSGRTCSQTFVRRLAISSSSHPSNVTSHREHPAPHHTHVLADTTRACVNRKGTKADTKRVCTNRKGTTSFHFAHACSQECLICTCAVTQAGVKLTVTPSRLVGWHGSISSAKPTLRSMYMIREMAAPHIKEPHPLLEPYPLHHHQRWGIR